MRWNKQPIDSQQVKQLHQRYGIDLLTASILSRRQIEPKDFRFYLEDDIRYLHNPFLFEDMEIAVDRVHEAIEQQEKVRIFGDRDVDGMTSTALLYQALTECGLEVSWRVPQQDEPYGLTRAGVQQMIEDEVTLFFTVDCGISNIEEVALAAGQGIEAIILDHHLPSETLPPAVAVIDPKIEGCGYPFADLAGCGVVAKFIWALNFSLTDLYHQEVVLLHAHPGNDTVIIDAVKLENLIETDRITEHVVPGYLPESQSRLAQFLVDRQILVYDQKVEKAMLQKAFGQKTEIHLIDIAQEVHRLFPQVAGKSLVRLHQRSKLRKYSSGGTQEIDLLVELFTSYVHRKYPVLSSEYEKLLDLVAIGTVADLMPMKGENRLLVKRGLKVLSQTPRSPIAVFLAQVNLAGKPISTTNIGWQISPVFNAAGRLGVPDIAVNLLLSSTPEEQLSLCSELISLNRKRKKLGDDCWNRILPKARKSLEEHEGKIIIVYDSIVNRGITGVMASRLMNMFKVPAIVIAKVESHLVGSMRSNKEVHVKDFLSQFDDIFLDHGGHQCAGGFSLKEVDFDEFLIRTDESSQLFESLDATEEIYIDAELPHAFMKPELIDLVETFEPYGVDHQPLQFLVKGVKILEAALLGNSEVKHVRMLIGCGAYKWPAIFWKAGERVGVDFSATDTVDVVFRFGRNYYKNMENLQLTILDIVRS